MPKISKRKLQSRQANQVSINMWQHKRIIHNINQMLTQMNDEEIGCNSLDLMELGVKKHQKQIKSESLTLEDNECENNQTLFDNLFGQN